MLIAHSNMAKNIRTLVSDIYGLFGSGHEPREENVNELAKAMATHVKAALAKREHKGTLRGSLIGTKCNRKLWFDVNKPDLAEELDPWVKVKFLMGNLYEEILLFLGQEAEHDIQKRQGEVNVKGVKGHIDAVIDGVLCDVKSASGYGMAKFKEHRLRDDDPFGYISQISFYREGLKDDPAVQVKGEVAFLAADKSNGQLVLDTYVMSDKDSKEILDRVDESIAMVNSGDIPDRGFSDVADGVSGNRKLCTQCSYCPYKDACWPGLKGYIYSTGPRWFTRISKEPNVPAMK